MVVYFENKDRYFEDDFNKIYDLKIKNEYSNSLTKLLGPLSQLNLFFGTGIPSEINKCIVSSDKIDFLISVQDDSEIEIHLGSKIFN